MQIAEALERKFNLEQTDLIRQSHGWFDAELGHELVSLSLGYDLYKYCGSTMSFDITHWPLTKNDVLMQIHISQFIGSPSFENVAISLNASRKLLPFLGDICEKNSVAYVVSATDQALSQILRRFIPSFIPVDALDVKSKLAGHIQFRRPNRQNSYYPIMAARGQDFIQDTHKFLAET